MKRIDRYILKTMLILFGFFALVLVAVYWVNRAVSLFERLIGDGQTAMVVLEFTLLTLPMVISVVLPVISYSTKAVWPPTVMLALYSPASVGVPLNASKLLPFFTW